MPIWTRRIRAAASSSPRLRAARATSSGCGSPGDARLFLVILEGLRLRRVWELIMGHKTPWMHELPAEAAFLSGSDPVIRSITVKAVEK